MLEIRQNLIEIFKLFDLDFSELIYDKIVEFEILFFKWNSVHNISAIRSKDDFYYKHVFDSLVLLALINKTRTSIFYELGSGNGFPGLLAALVLKTKNFILIDSSQKKTIFLNYALRKLGIENAKVLTSHFEKLDYSNEQFGVFSRALGLYEEQLNFFSKTKIASLYFMATEEIYKNLSTFAISTTKFKKIENNNYYYKLLNKKCLKYENKTIITVF